MSAECPVCPKADTGWTTASVFGEMLTFKKLASPPDFGKLIAEETDKWAQVIRTANIKPD
jgi:hypothetical protein